MKNITITFQPLLVIIGIIGILFGVLITIFMTNIVHGENSTINACVKSNGSIRIISGNKTCISSETPLSWNIQGPPGPDGPPGSGYFGLPFICTHDCDLSLYADKFAGKDFSNAFIINSSFKTANLQGVIFNGAVLYNTTFENTDLSNADLSNLLVSAGGAGNLNFSGANLTNTNFSNDVLLVGIFTNAILQNTNFSNADLRTSTNFGTTTRSNVIWSNTICPDGTNSDNNGNTCEGHF